jgi:hypothetical protein
MKKWLALIGVLSILFCATGDRSVYLEDAPSIPMPKISSEEAPIIYCAHLSGTGIVLENGFVLTASHVVQGGKTCTIRGTDIRSSDILLTVVKDNPTMDFTVLHGKISVNHPFSINCAGFQTGAKYFMAGHPYATGLIIVPVSALDIYVNGRPSPALDIVHLRELVGTSHPGMSGGPVVDPQRQVIGFVSARPTTDDSITMVKELEDTYLCTDK